LTKLQEFYLEIARGKDQFDEIMSHIFITNVHLVVEYDLGFGYRRAAFRYYDIELQ